MSFRSAFVELVVDDSAQALAEYALVLATLTISTILAFQLLASTANSNVSGNEQNFSNSATAAGAGSGLSP